MNTINIAKEFTDTPGWRFREQGDFSGEEFRDDVLEPAFINSNEKITVILDGARGYGVSFLEESFGGLARKHPTRTQEILSRITIVSEEEPHWIDKIRNYIIEGSRG